MFTQDEITKMQYSNEIADRIIKILLAHKASPEEMASIRRLADARQIAELLASEKRLEQRLASDTQNRKSEIERNRIPTGTEWDDKITAIRLKNRKK